MTTLFDTLRYVERLKSAGVPEVHAKAKVEALAVALAESVGSRRPDMGDIASVKAGLGAIRSEIKMILWLTTMALAGVVLLLARGFL